MTKGLLTGKYIKKTGIIALLCIFTLFMGGCTKNNQSAPSNDDSAATSETSEAQDEGEKHYWVSWQKDVYNSDSAPGGVDESLDALVWMVFREGTLISEDQPADEDACISESIQVLNGLEETGDNLWIRVVQEPYIATGGVFGQVSHKDYVFYRQGEDAYIGVQSAEDDELWTLLKMADYGDWLEKEIKIYVRMTTGL